MLKVFIFLLLQVSICFAETGPGDLPGDSIYQVKSKWVDQFGKKVELSSLAGKPVAVSMIYLSCKFSCPMTVAHMKELEKILPDNLKNDVQFVLVSFDGKNDTPTVMKKYAEKHGLAFPKWRFLTSKNEQDVREFSSLIDFKYKKIANGDFEHSFGIVALDSHGRVLGSTVGAAMAEKDLIPLFEKK
jgi:protein SCO1/2